MKARLAELKAMTGEDANGRNLELLNDFTADDIKVFAENIKFSEDGKTVTITGPLFSDAAFIVAKGAKTANLNSPYNLTLFRAGAPETASGGIKKADKLAKIEIHKSGVVTIIPLNVQ